MNPVIIIPAFNPTPILNNLILAINNIVKMPIIIIDDGSIPSIKINFNNVLLLKNFYNKGKGYSLKKAFIFAYDNKYTHAITLDSDFQHDPKYLPAFLDEDPNISLLIGKRNFMINMPLNRKISNYLTSYILSFICKQKIYDSQSGYRRYKLADVCNEISMEDGFQYESEILIKLLVTKKCKLRHVDISTLYNNEKSSINNILDTIKFIKLIFNYLLLKK